MVLVFDIKIVSLATNIPIRVWYTNLYKVINYA